MNDPEHFDCIIVGAGPVGMTAAALLSAGGATVLVLEQNPGTSSEPKAISIDDEALRTYARAGLADRLLKIIVPGTGTQYLDACHVPLFNARAERPYRLGYPFKNPFAQPDLEQLLLTALEERPNVTLRFGARVTGVSGPSSTDTTAIEYTAVEYTAGGASQRATGSYVLGADGGRSSVRTALGIPLEGRSHADNWLVVDALNDPHRERFGMHVADPKRPHVIVPGLQGRCRYEFRLFDGEGEAGSTPPFTLIQRVLTPYRDIAAADVERAVIYRFNGLIATKWRVGNTFLLGDAAHMMPPFAGQGLNSGIRDAANLSWKLLAALQGTAPDRLLDTYQPERFGHALATIKASEQLGRIVMTTSERVAAVRDRRVREALQTPAGREFFEYMRYRPSARLTDGLLFNTADATVGTQLGQPRAFATRTSTVQLLDEITGPGWRLFRVDGTETPWPAEVTDFATRHHMRRFDVPLRETFPSGSDGEILIDVDTRLIEEFLPLRGRIALVRPDHVIAATWDPARSDEALAAIQPWWTV